MNPGPVGAVVMGPTQQGGEDKSNMDASIKTDLEVVSLNVRGLNDAKKVRHLISNCYKRSKTSTDKIFLLQETYVAELPLLNYIWRGDYHLNPREWK